jgi:hypothetical protein
MDPKVTVRNNGNGTVTVTVRDKGVVRGTLTSPVVTVTDKRTGAVRTYVAR